MEKLIIENHTDLPMAEVLSYVKAVLLQGRISGDNNQYCYHSGFEDGVVISTIRNEKSDRFVLTHSKRLQQTLQGALEDSRP